MFPSRLLTLTLEQEAEAVIRRWADQSEAMAPARPYSVLAAFCMARSQAKGAAAAHFHQAQRLQAECLPTLPTLAMLIEALGETNQATHAGCPSKGLAVIGSSPHGLCLKWWSMRVFT